MAGRSKLKEKRSKRGKQGGETHEVGYGSVGLRGAEDGEQGKDKKDGGRGEKKKKKKGRNNYNQAGPRERILSLERSFGGDEFRDKQWGRRAVCDSASRRRVSTIKL